MKHRMAMASLCLAGGAFLAGCGGGGSGAGESNPGSAGPSAMRLVSAGAHASSANYRMVFSVGEPVKEPAAASSSHYQLQGGLCGASGSLP